MISPTRPAGFVQWEKQGEGVHWFKNIIIKRELFVKEQIIVQPIFNILALSFVAVANLGLGCRRLSNSQLHEDR